MRRALQQIALANTPSYKAIDFDAAECARHALKKVAALPHLIPCGCKVHINDQLTISIVTPCSVHAVGPARALPKRRRRS